MSWIRVHLRNIMTLLCARLVQNHFLAVVDSGIVTTFSVSIKQKLFPEAILNLVNLPILTAAKLISSKYQIKNNG